MPAPNSTRHRHNHSVTLSRSQDGYQRSLSRSRERTNHTPNGDSGPNRHQNLDHDTDDRDSDIDHTHPPLLMAPPTTLLGDLRHRAALLFHRAGQNTGKLALIAKLALFLLKMATLQQVCWPYSVGRVLGACLFTAAAVELVLPWLSEEEVRSTTRQQPAIEALPKGAADPAFAEGAGGSGAQGEPPSPADARRGATARRSSGRGHGAAWSKGASGWDWRVSLLLLASHYLILGVASRYRALCAVPNGETWSRW